MAAQIEAQDGGGAVHKKATDAQCKRSVTQSTEAQQRRSAEEARRNAQKYNEDAVHRKRRKDVVHRSAIETQCTASAAALKAWGEGSAAEE